MKKVALLVVLLVGYCTNAQIRVGIESNSQYYLDDDKIKLDPREADERFRSNNYIKLDYAIKNFEFRLQGEGYYPKAILNYNPQLQDFNVGTIFARYKNFEKGIDITAGHIYEQFGSGLALRFWEDRALGINNALFGGRVKLNMGDAAQIKLLGGKQRVGMGFDFSEGLVYGADVEIDIANLLAKENYTLKFGSSFVGRYEDITNLSNDKNNPDKFKDVPKTTDIFGSRIDYSGQRFNLNVEYLYKTKDVQVESSDIQQDILRSGNAFLINSGYNTGDFAINVNLRRLENFTFHSQRNMQGNVFNYGMINFVPSLTKQYDHSLQNIYVYQAQPQMVYYVMNKEKQGEIGGQFDMFYEAAKGSFFGGKTGASFAINGSYWAGLKNNISREIVKGEFGEDIEKVKMDSDLFAFGKKYYSDFAIEYRKPFSDKLNTIFSYLNQYHNSDFITEKPYQVKAHTLAAEGTYFLSETKSVRLELQHQWADQERKNWAGGTVEYVPSSKWSFFIHDIYNYGSDKENEKLHYYSAGGAFSQGATRIAASYGRQRGGMMCVGGVCRFVPESAGFSLNITTNF